jgi:hypothetical protein
MNAAMEGFYSAEGAMMHPDPGDRGERGPWIQVFTGGRFYPFDPQPAEIHIRDIAHALSQQTRFTGHLKEFWSVAQHSIEVSKLCSLDTALWGLLHDASEAYMTDVARPIKHDPRMKFYRDQENIILRAIMKRFDLLWPEPSIVQTADKMQLGREARDLMGSLQPGWEKWIKMAGALPIIKPFEPMDPRRAELAFLERYEELTGRVQ